jgi:ArsR family transcriptional regulator
MRSLRPELLSRRDPGAKRRGLRPGRDQRRVGPNRLSDVRMRDRRRTGLALDGRAAMLLKMGVATDELAIRFQALSDPTRLRILALLMLQGEMCVCQIEGALDITQSKSSRHLRCLLHAGLVENRRVGLWIYYRLPDRPDFSVKTLLETLRLLTKNDHAELRKRIQSCCNQDAGKARTRSKPLS